MAARAMASGPMCFGLVQFNVKYYKVAENEGVSFKMITPEGHPIRQKYFDSVSGNEYTYAQCSKGYELKDSKPTAYVLFDKAELEALESKGFKGGVEITQCAPIESIDVIHVENSYYIQPDKGGDKAFKLLSNALSETEMAAIGRWSTRGKDHLVMIRPYKGGLILHTLYYQNEVRDYENNCAVIPISAIEMKMAKQLIKHMAVKKFDISQFKDEYTDRVLAAVEKKKKNPKEKISVEEKKPAETDLFAALAASLESLDKSSKGD